VRAMTGRIGGEGVEKVDNFWVEGPFALYGYDYEVML
jgi:hypothetical protein